MTIRFIRKSPVNYKNNVSSLLNCWRITSSQRCQRTAARVTASGAHCGMRHGRQPEVSIHLSLPTAIPDSVNLTCSPGRNRFAQCVSASRQLLGALSQPSLSNVNSRCWSGINRFTAREKTCSTCPVPRKARNALSAVSACTHRRDGVAIAALLCQAPAAISSSAIS